VPAKKFIAEDMMISLGGRSHWRDPLYCQRFERDIDATAFHDLRNRRTIQFRLRPFDM
jgi:hypothetical protein